MVHSNDYENPLDASGFQQYPSGRCCRSTTKRNHEVFEVTVSVRSCVITFPHSRCWQANPTNGESNRLVSHRGKNITIARLTVTTERDCLLRPKKKKDSKHQIVDAIAKKDTCTCWIPACFAEKTRWSFDNSRALIQSCREMNPSICTPGWLAQC